MGIWSTFEKEILIDNYGNNGTKIPQLLITHSRTGIKKKARRLDLNYSGRHSELKTITITNNLKELIDGLILGDGGFNCAPNSARIEITQAEKTKDWLNDIKNRLEKEGAYVTKIRQKGKAKKTLILGKNCYRQSNFRIRTSNYINLKVEMEKWGCIKNKKTKIPDDCSIAPLSLAYWYMGDGSLENRNNQYLVRFATYCFTKHSQEIFKKRIEKKYGWKLSFEKHYINNIDKWTLSMYGQDDILDFLQIMNPYMVDCFSYKWRALWDEKWLDRKRRNNFTDEELIILKNDYPKKGRNIPDLFKRHTPNSIKRQANSLGFKRATTWTKEQIIILKRDYQKKGINIPELLKNHTRDALSHKAYMLGLTDGIPLNLWTEREITILKKEYPEKGRNIPELLEIRSKVSITHKAGRLKIRRNF